MNKFVFDDAISLLDSDLIEEHIKEKERMSHRRISKIARLKKCVAIAACMCLAVIVAIPTIINLIGYKGHDREDEIYRRTHTEFQTYEDVCEVIGNDTLLENIDFSKAENYELKLTHELDDVSKFKALGYINTMPNDTFGVGIYFPSSDEKDKDFCDSGNIITVNNIPVDIDKVESDFSYFYVAEFEYDGCKYVVRGYGDTSEDIFWNNLYKLLGN